jgi:hypothetical protein
VGVAVDEARRDDQAVGVDGALRHRAEAPDLDDAPARHAQVRAVARRTRAVHDRPVANDQVEPHGILLVARVRGRMMGYGTRRGPTPTDKE